MVLQHSLALSVLILIVGAYLSDSTISLLLNRFQFSSAVRWETLFAKRTQKKRKRTKKKMEKKRKRIARTLDFFVPAFVSCGLKDSLNISSVIP